MNEPIVVQERDALSSQFAGLEVVSNVTGVPSNTVWFRRFLDRVLTTELLRRRPRHAFGLRAEG